MSASANKLVRACLPSIAAVAVLVVSAPAQAQQRVTLKLQSGGELHAEVPFVIAAIAEGFEEKPEPTISELKIRGATVTPLGVTPEVATQIQILGGRQSVHKRVTWVYRYRIEAPRAGTFQIPRVEVTQGSKKASSRQATFSAKSIQATRNMQLRVVLPNRPVWVGESFDVFVDWYVNRDPKSPSFVIPLFEAEDKVLIKAPAGATREKLPFTIGTAQVELPYTTEKATLDGVAYTRFRFRALVTPKGAGILQLPAAKVVARLQSGTGRDGFGFRVRKFGSFKATDKPTKLEVRPLPLKDRPSSFENAVGSKFSIKVQAPRTVVRVGDPVRLDILIRGESSLEGMSLPRLDKAGLSADKFAVPDESPPGEKPPNGKGKLFKLTVRVKEKNVREIPPIEFSYFDPAVAKYVTVKSDPIALQVQGSSVVGAGDVVGGGTNKKPEPGTKTSAPASDGTLSLVGADLALSKRGDTMRTVLTAAGIRPFVIGLYALVLLLLAGRLWQLRTRDRRGQGSEVKQRLRAVEEALERGRTEPGRESAPAIAGALRALARATGNQPSDEKELFARLETEGYSRDAANDALDRAVIELADKAAKAWAAQAKQSKSGKGAVVVSMLLIGLSGLVLAAPSVSAAPSVAADGETGLEAARTAYMQALDQGDRDVRTRMFRRAEALYRALVQASPGRPELLTDWGNAALGAQDMGRATLGFRRALFYDRSLGRAKRNLSWVRERAPSWLPPPERGGAIDSLFFWHTRMSVPQRHIGAAVAFALAIMLLMPWGTRRDGLMRRFSILPMLVFVGMITSAFLEPDHSDEIVVIADEVVLRSGDSSGALPAMANPIPGGAEATIVTTSPGWVRIAFSNGSQGWLESAAVARIVR